MNLYLRDKEKFQEGARARGTEIVKRMLEQGADIDTINLFTGISPDRIREIQQIMKNPSPPKA